MREKVAREQVEAWFAARRWKPFRYQRQVWAAYARGESGLIHAPTGLGKTYAAWFGPLREWLEENPDLEAWNLKAPPPLTVLWVTPLRALAANTEVALRATLEALNLPWTLERRTGDVSAAVRSRQRRRLPTALVTTPESLTLLLSRENAALLFGGLRVVIVDEWHELLGSKRGVQTQLALARLRRWRPDLRTWGLSATLGNIEEARDALFGPQQTSRQPIRASQKKIHHIDGLIPRTMDRFPWAGHLGLRMAEQVAAELDDCNTAIVFTNTRSQAELWHRALREARPGWDTQIGIHHGSLSGEERDAAERGIDSGTLRAVVATSSLDLGVDFAPVERVLQVGSPKGVARLLQRAGRSGHQPGAVSRVTCVPTHAFELVEIAAARDAAQRGEIEARTPPLAPLDVLVQHIMTVAAAGGFAPDTLFEEVRQTYAYENLPRAEFQWALDFLTTGGRSLKGHPEYHRLVHRNGRYLIEDKDVATRHRLSIGTITSDASIRIKPARGANLGTVEESFLARMRPGDTFMFAGRPLELVRVRDMEAIVRKGDPAKAAVPRWMGGRMPLSGQLAGAVRRKLGEARDGVYEGAEMAAIRPILELQARWSVLPGPDDFLVEQFKTREGHHLVFFPFAGRLVHEGLAALFAFRLARRKPMTFAFSVNDYGFELVSRQAPPLDEELPRELFETEDLIEDIQGTLNLSELARRRFRDIARISGLLFPGYPWSRKGARQFQASGGLLYDVFQRLEPDHPLLDQARSEMLEEQFEEERLRETLLRLQTSNVLLRDPGHATPLSFPLVVEAMRGRLTTEKLIDRVLEMKLRLEKAAKIGD